MDLLAGSSETVICSSLGLQVIVIHSSTTYHLQKQTI